jgi:sugar lactone lactonase YvrE
MPIFTLDLRHNKAHVQRMMETNVMRSQRFRSEFSRLTMFALGVTLLTSGGFAQTSSQSDALQHLGSAKLSSPSSRLNPALQGGIQATTTPLALPAGVAFDAGGNLYIADLNNNVVRKVDLAGIITTVAGDGEQGYSGNGGAATDAQLDSPAGVAIDAQGNLFIADTHNHCIREVAGGTITTIAGTGVAGFSGDGGAAASAMLNQPTALAVGPDGSLYVADTDNHRIRKIIFGSSGTTITTVAGDGEQFFSGDGAAATLAGLDSPNGVAVDASGNIYIGDTHNQCVRVVDAAGVISTLAGNGHKTYSGDGAAATSASLARPRGLSVDAQGNIYVADSDNNRIRVIAKTGIITTLAGNGSQGFTGDGGPAVNAMLDTPRATAVAATGVVALSDTNNQRVREVSSDGDINTIAGLNSTAGGVSVGESLLLNGASTIAYGSGSLTATFSNNGLVATGNITLVDITSGSLPIGSAALSGNVSTISVAAMSAGLHRIVANYSGDANNPGIISGVFLLTVAPLPLSASVTDILQQYGQAIPSITGTLSGVLPQDTGNVIAVFGTAATSTSPVGQYPITVSLTGTAAGNYTVSLAAGSGDLAIGRAASAISLTSLNPTPYLGASATMTARVSSTTTGMPTGSVVFYDGATLLSTATIDPTGSVSYSTNALASGAHSITAVYSGDANFSSVTSAVTVVTVGAVPDFTISSAGATSQVVNPGQSVTYNFTVQSQGAAFPSPVTLTASGLPVGATATFAPATITPGSAAATFNLSILAPTLKAENVIPSSSRNPLLPLTGALLLLPLMGNRRLRARLGRVSPTLFGAILLVLSGAALLGLTGCGSGGFATKNPQSYNITVTATATSAVGTTLQHATTVTLIVQ